MSQQFKRKKTVSALTCDQHEALTLENSLAYLVNRASSFSPTCWFHSSAMSQRAEVALPSHQV